MKPKEKTESDKTIISCTASTCSGCDEDLKPCKSWRWENVYGLKKEYMETKDRVFRCPHCMSLSDEQYARCPVCHKFLTVCQ